MFDLFTPEGILDILYSIPAILFCLSIHEFSHGYIASKLGDPTARNFGRLTLNPAKHIDPIGFIALIVAHFGWAKPVPVNMRYFKKPKRDMALTAIAGPVSNLLSAFVFGFVYALVVRLAIGYATVHFQDMTPQVDALWTAGISIAANFFYINISLAIFNLIPIPPLDGSRILDSVLPQKAYVAYHKYEQYISIILLVVLLATDILDPILSGAVSRISEVLLYIPEKVFLS